MPQIRYHGSQAELRAEVAQLVQMLSGRLPDSEGALRIVQLRMGIALLSKIKQAFLVKSRGGTGDDGIHWAPLKRSTIAQRRTTGGERKSLGIGGKRTRGLLTAAQDKRWRQIFGSRLAQLRVRGVPNAAALAAQIAWAILKSEGAKTKLAVLGGRKVDALRDTGELFRSLTPGVEDRPSGADGQILRVAPGSVIVGTNKKPWHHKGIPGRLPARPLWPEKLPVAWWAVINAAALRGLMLLAISRLERSR